MTTPQIYGLFAMLTAAAIAGLIFYCIGLRTGRAAGFELGRATSSTYWKKIVGNVRAKLGEARDLLDARTREMATLRQCIEQETADHAAAMTKLKQHMHFAENDRENVIRDLLEELQQETANRLTTDDWLNLKLAAKQLGIAAHQHARSGSAKTNQAAQAQACITALTERVKAILDQPPRPCEPARDVETDTDLIEWLQANSSIHCTNQELRLTIQAAIPSDTWLKVAPDLRRLLSLARLSQNGWSIEVLELEPMERGDAEKAAAFFKDILNQADAA